MMRKFLLTCGVLYSLLYVGMNILAALSYEGYSSASQTVSELSAIGAPTRTFWAFLGPAYSLLVITFGWGVWRSAARNRSLRIVGGLIMIGFAVTGLAWHFAPMHSREVLVAGGGTLTDTMHIVVGIRHGYVHAACDCIRLPRLRQEVPFLFRYHDGDSFRIRCFDVFGCSSDFGKFTNAHGWSLGAH